MRLVDFDSVAAEVKDADVLYRQRLAEFKARHAKHPYAHGMIDGKYDFRFDCVRFAHKVAAVTDAASKQRPSFEDWETFDGQ